MNIDEVNIRILRRNLNKLLKTTVGDNYKGPLYLCESCGMLYDHHIVWCPHCGYKFNKGPLKRSMTIKDLYGRISKKEFIRCFAFDLTDNIFPPARLKNTEYKERVKLITNLMDKV
jgi:hypothetical protein